MIPKYDHVIVSHASSISTFTRIVQTVLCWFHQTQCRRSEMRQIKHLPELNILTVWYVTSVSRIMRWYVALFWEDCRYFCCSSQNNLMKGEIFLWSVSKIIDLKSLLKSALTGKDAFDIFSWSYPSFILILCFPFDKFELFILSVLERFVKLGHLALLVKYFLYLFLKAFLWWIRHFFHILWSFLQLSFGLSIKSTYEIEW